MTRIGIPGQGPAGRPNQAQEGRGANEAGRNPDKDTADPRRDAFGRRDGGGLRGGSRGLAQGGRDGVTDSAQERGAPFKRLIEERTHDRDHGAEADTREQRGDARILALADIPPVMVASVVNQPAAPLFPSAGASPALPMTDGHRIVALAERIEEAVRLDRLAQVQGGGSFRIVGDAAGGLEAITVVLTPASLDVTLTHHFDARPENLAQAAALLASQLQDRFTTRRVRILEAVDANRPHAASGDGLAEIGLLLGHRAR